MTNCVLILSYTWISGRFACVSPGESWAGDPPTLWFALGGSGAATGGIRALIELVPGEDSRTVGIGLLSVKQKSTVGDIRCVCWVGISHIGDLLLGLASLSCELSYCQILVLEY